MSRDFKPIKFEDLKLSPEDMAKIAVGAALFMQQPDDEDEVAEEPLVTPRPKRDTV